MQSIKYHIIRPIFPLCMGYLIRILNCDCIRRQSLDIILQECVQAVPIISCTMPTRIVSEALTSSSSSLRVYVRLFRR